jgi:uncharacterized protein YdaU (DUF1376 family)
MANQPAGFVLYTNDWREGTKGLSWSAKGLYLELLTICWDLDGLYADPAQIRRMLGAGRARDWSKVWPKVAQKFPIAEDGKRRNPKLERIRANHLEKQRLGRLGAETRWHRQLKHRGR